MEDITKNRFFAYPLLKLAVGTSLYSHVRNDIMKSNLKDIKEHIYRNVDNDTWHVFEGSTFKLTVNESHTYNCFFSKISGLNIRFGKNLKDDPQYCGLGPEILDLEVSVNGCTPVKGSCNCKYCYKNNNNSTPTNMTFETFKLIMSKFPKNLSQIAFGITGLNTNPDLIKMLEYSVDNGIIPNLTTVGADMTDKIKDALCKNCGAVAVSCYPGAKELCYSTINDLKQYAEKVYKKDMHINMHIVVSEDNAKHIFEVLDDIASKKVKGLRSIVFLRIKPKGRAEKLNCKISPELYEKIIKFCIKNNISFGFDSCSAKSVMKVLSNIGMEHLCNNCESCESSSLSSYINVNGEYCSCSFVEGRLDVIKPLKVLDYNTFSDLWNSESVVNIRNVTAKCEESCPWYKLD